MEGTINLFFYELHIRVFHTKLLKKLLLVECKIKLCMVSVDEAVEEHEGQGSFFGWDEG